jgi:hypothetical protein
MMCRLVLASAGTEIRPHCASSCSSSAFDQQSTDGPSAPIKTGQLCLVGARH